LPLDLWTGFGKTTKLLPLSLVQHLHKGPQEMENYNKALQLCKNDMDLKAECD
jgi:hypothetical protein